MSRRLIAAMLGLMLCTTVSAQPDRIAPVHQDLHIELDPAARALRVRAQITLEGSGRTRLALRADFVVEDLALDGRPLAQAPAREGEMQVWWLELSGGAAHQLLLRYAGPLAALPETDHRGTLQELPPMAGAAGSYLPGGSGWYPLVGEHPFTYRVALELPAGQRGLVPGRLVAEQADAAGYRAQYEFSHKERDSAQAARAMRLDWLRDFAAVAPGQDFALREFTARSHGTSQIVGYHKAAYVFLMLRDLLGTHSFDAGLRRFWRDNRFRHASWDDLRRAFEQDSGRSLSLFFAQWLDRAGAPELKITAAHVRPEAGGSQVDLSIEQTPPPYALQVPIHLTGAPADRTERVNIDTVREKVRLEAPLRPASVAVDPELRLFRRLDPRELPPILRQVMLDPSTALVLASPDAAVRDAAGQLAARLLDAEPQPDTGEPPLLVIGLEHDVDRLLAERSLPVRPGTLKGAGSAQVWAARQANGKPLVVVSARDAESLLALQRPLPHYGRQSWLVFEGAKAVDRGVWPAEQVGAPVELD